jgi:Flp pilus assembly protein TadD
LRKALSLNHDFADAHQELDVLLFERNQVADSIGHLTDAARLAPRSATAHAALGGALAQAGRLMEAVTHLQQALTLDPSNTAARDNLGRISRK